MSRHYLPDVINWLPIVATAMLDMVAMLREPSSYVSTTGLKKTFLTTLQPLWVWNRLLLKKRPKFKPSALQDPQPPITTVGLTVAHFVAGQQPFMADFNVPFPDSQTIEMPARYLSLTPK